MRTGNNFIENPLSHVERKIRSPLEGRNRQRSVGLTQIAGTHGTRINSIVNLARSGEFKGGSRELQNTFYATPNLQFLGWKKSKYSEDISKIITAVGLVNPLEISREYTESRQDFIEESEPDETYGLSEHGVVIAFSGKILELIRAVDMDEITQEPEIVLAKAPPLDSIRAIYPVDESAQNALQGALDDLR